MAAPLHAAPMAGRHARAVRDGRWCAAIAALVGAIVLAPGAGVAVAQSAGIEAGPSGALAPQAGTAAPVALTDPGSLVWTQADAGQDFDTAELRALAVVADGAIVVAGDRVTAGKPPDAAAWRSGDGASYRRVKVAAPKLSYATSLAVWSGGVAMAGTSADVVGVASRPTALLWRSADGTRWQAASGSTFAEAVVSSLAPTPGGLAAVGRDPWTRDPGSRSPVAATRDPVVWTSTDGSSWTRTVLPTADDVARSVALPLVLIAPAAGPWLVAGVGPDPYMTPLLWRSDDGVSWTSVTPPSSEPGASFGGLAVTSGGFVFVDNTDADPSIATFWLSPDGVAWQQVHQATGPVTLRQLGPGAFGLGPGSLVTSADGSTWQDAATTALDDWSVSAVALAGDGRVIVAASALAGLPGAIIVGTPPGA
jgi:hypothetical protein